MTPSVSPRAGGAAQINTEGRDGLGAACGPLGLRVFMQDGNQSLLNAVSGPAPACWVVPGWLLVSSCFSHISVHRGHSSRLSITQQLK